MRLAKRHSAHATGDKEGDANEHATSPEQLAEESQDQRPHEGIFMSNGNRPSRRNNLPHADEIYPVYERERTPNWIFLAVVAAMIYWIMATYFGH